MSHPRAFDGLLAIPFPQHEWIAMTRTMLFNLVLGGLDLAAVWLIARRPGAARALGALTVLGLAAGLLVLGFSVNFFHAASLLAWALFAHGVVVSTVLAVVLFRKGRALASVLAASAVAIAAVGVDAFAIEPYRLEVSRVRVPTAKLDRRVRVAVLADLQTDRFGAHELKALRAVVAARPDLILLPGDYIQVGDNAERAGLRARLRRALNASRFDAPLGVFAVQGDVEPPDWPTGFLGTPVRPITTTATIDVGPLGLTALDYEDSFDTALRLRTPPDRFSIAFGHGPDFALGDVGADLLVAGHTHGGQVRLPFIGPLVTLSEVPRAWAAGVTRLSRGRTLVVSRGVGMERGHAPRLRFLCRPEVVVIDLVPA